MAKKKVKKVKKVVEPVVEIVEPATVTWIEPALLTVETVNARIDKLVSVLKDVKGIKSTVFDGI